MKVAAVVAACAGVALGAPGSLVERGAAQILPSGCGGVFYSSAMCCRTTVLGVANLDCQVVPKSPRTPVEFKTTCAKVVKQAQCCFLKLGNVAVLCRDV